MQVRDCDSRRFKPRALELRALNTCEIMRHFFFRSFASLALCSWRLEDTGSKDTQGGYISAPLQRKPTMQQPQWSRRLRHLTERDMPTSRSSISILSAWLQ